MTCRHTDIHVNKSYSIYANYVCLMTTHVDMSWPLQLKNKLTHKLPCRQELYSYRIQWLRYHIIGISTIYLSNMWRFIQYHNKIQMKIVSTYCWIFCCRWIMSGLGSLWATQSIKQRQGHRHYILDCHILYYQTKEIHSVFICWSCQ